RRDLLPVVAAGALSGCNRDRKKVIAVIPKSTSSVFWVAVEAGARAAAQEFQVDIDWNGPAAETEYSRQVQIVDSIVTRHVDGIALAATNRTSLNQALERASAAGIPVTVFDSGVDSTNYMSFLATDNVEGGRMGARELGRLLGGKGKAAVVMHAPGSF